MKHRTGTVTAAAVLAALLALSACAGSQTGPDAASASAASEPEEAASAAQELTLAAPTGFAVSGTLTCLPDASGVDGYASEQGFYRAIPRADFSVNLCYIDFASAQEIYLCSQPGCTHDSDACPAWLPFANGRMLPIPVGDRVVLLHGGRPQYADVLGSDAVAQIDVMAQDGSARQRVAEFSATEQVAAVPRGGLARDNKNVYFVLADTVSGVRTLCAVDSLSGELFRLYTLPEEEEKIIAADGQALILSYTPGSYSTAGADTLTTHVVRLDLNTMSVTSLFTYPYADFCACSGSECAVLGSDGTIRLYDLTDGAQKRELATGLYDVPQTKSWYIAGLYEGKLLVYAWPLDTDEENLNRHPYVSPVVYYAVDLDSGALTEMPYTYNRLLAEDSYQATPCSIAAQTQTQYLCVCDMEYSVASYRKADGEAMEDRVDTNLYALVDKDAFWAGNAVLTPVADQKN